MASLRSCQGDAWVREWALLPCHLSVTLRAGGLKEKRPQMMHGSSAVHHLSSALVAKVKEMGRLCKKAVSAENTQAKAHVSLSKTVGKVKIQSYH